VIIDGLCYLGQSLFGYRATTQELVAQMDELKIDRAIVCPVRPPEYRLESANDAIADAVASHPTRLAGLLRVDPWQGEAAVIEAGRGFDRLGLQGLFLHAGEETFRINSPMVHPLVEAARRRQKPVVVATGFPWFSEALQLADLAARFPEVTFIATNGAQMNISGLGQQDAEIALEVNPNIWIQTMGVYREDFLQRVVERFGSGRVTFASGFPLFNMTFEMHRIEWGHFDAASRERIIGGNLANVFAWDESAPAHKPGARGSR
jgi:predicted TIM-barrel fold metal-dependent hydrolase